MSEAEVLRVFDRWCKKLRLTPDWDVRLEWVDDPDWRKTGDFKVDCDDKKAILLLNRANPKQENFEEVILHELMHLKLYPLDPYVEAPVALMEVVPGDTVETPIWDVYQTLCDRSEGKPVKIEHVERFAFYERAKKAYCVIMTGESALYANIILKKGVVVE